MKKRNYNSKQILFATGANPFGGTAAGGTKDLATTATPPAGNGSGKEASLADELMRRVYAWFENGTINYAQWMNFRELMTKEPAPVDAKMDGVELVVVWADGQEQRLLPTDANLPEVVIRPLDSPVPTRWQRMKVWISTHKAATIGIGAVVVVLVVLVVRHFTNK